MPKCPECKKPLTVKDGKEVCDGCGFERKLDGGKTKKDGCQKKEDSLNVVHQDLRDLYWESNTTPMTLTEEGYLEGKAAVTNIGVFPYRTKSGKIRMELRCPEEVFNEDSLSSLKLVPITNEHHGRVDSSNIGKFGVGNVGERIDNDPYRVYAPLSIQKQDAIKAIQNGKLALSCGYTADLDFTPGNYLGMKYDAIQRNIRYNHVALVRKGRAGDDAVLRLDGEDGLNNELEQPATGPNKSNTRRNPMKKIIIDGAQYEVDDEVHAHISALNAKLDTADVDLQAKADEAKEAQGKVTTLEAERDSEKARADKAEKDLKEKQDAAPGDVDALVKAKMALMSSCEKAGVEFNEDDSDLDVKKKVILSLDKTADLEEKEDAYIQARFDIAMERMDKESDEDRKNRLALKDDKEDHQEEKQDADDARQKMIKKLESGSAE